MLHSILEARLAPKPADLMTFGTAPLETSLMLLDRLDGARVFGSVAVQAAFSGAVAVGDYALD